MRSRSKKRPRKTDRNLNSHPDSFLDEEQIATENLFNVSDFYDHTNYEKDFNGIFDMFRSVDLEEKFSNSSQTDNKNTNFTKFTSNVREDKNNWRKTSAKKQKFQEPKILIQLHQSSTEQDSSKSPTLRIRKQKFFEKQSTSNQRVLTLKAFKSGSVFVGKNQQNESFIKDDKNDTKFQNFLHLKNDRNSLTFKKSEKLQTPRKLADLTIFSSQKKSQKMTKQVLKNLKTFSLHEKPQLILLDCLEFKRLQSLHTVRPLSKTTLGPCSERKKKMEEKTPRKSIQENDTRQMDMKFSRKRGKELEPCRYKQINRRKQVFF